MNFSIRLLSVFIILIYNGNCFSQKVIKINKTDNPPVIDGRVNDKCWETAALINEFYQREPKEGEPMTDSTKVFICYDENNIFFGIKCYQDPETIFSKEMLRDASTGNDDRFHIMLDTYLDHRNAYFFGITALGSKEDAIVNPNGMNRSWNGLWEGITKQTNEGWEIEYSIPFKSVGFNSKSDSWGLLMNRFITKKREWGTWPVANINSPQFSIPEEGIIEGLIGITQGIGLDISPYFITGFDTKNEDKTKYKINGGTDIFYQVTPNMKASITINTDFAETETDARQINLTRFSLKLAEKRNFFLDGSNYFNFGLEGGNLEAPSGKVNPFFSRTIGLDSKGSPVPVHYGAKLTGNINKLNIGLLHLSDERDYGNSHFSVGRIKYNIGKQSSIGMITTYGNSRDSTRNIIGGLDLKLASSSFMGNKNISLILFGMKSNTEQIEGRDISWGGTFTYPNDLINFNIGHVEIGTNFIAGMGYVPRPNIKETFGSLTIGPRLNKWGIRQITFGGNFDYITDFSNKLQSKGFTINPIGIRFESGERLNYSLNYNYDFLDKDFNIYSDYIIPAAEYVWWENKLSIMTEGSRKLSGRFSYGFGNFYTGKQNSYDISLFWKAAIPVFIGGTYSSNIVRLPEGKFAADIIQLNFNYLFSPDLTLYNYFQFDSQSKLIGWQTRFRWILKPGNEILIVWNSDFSRPLEHYVMNESALRFKMIYNIRF